MDLDVINQISTVSFSLDNRLKVSRTSKLLQKSCPNLEGGKLLDFFEIRRPEVNSYQDLVRNANELILAVSKDGNFAFRGQFILSSDLDGELKFVGTPWLSWMASNSDFSLSIKDFPPFDAQLDYLVYLTTEKQRRTEMDSLNCELKKAKEAVENTLQSQSELFSMMSHEMGTQIASIYAAINMLQEKELNESDRSFVQISRNAIKNLRIIFDQALNYSKLKHKGLKNEPIVFEPEELLESLLESFSSMLEERCVRLTYNYTGAKAVFADAMKIKHVLSNLVDNALKHTEKGSINIFFDFQIERQKIRFRVADSGKGIPIDQQQYIFSEFWTSKSYISSEIGSGLGLAICKKMLDCMGGSICFESIENKGSCFYVELPAMLADGLDNNHSYQTEEIPKEPSLGIEQPKGKLLLVDDNMTNCYLTQLHLNAQGFEVEIAKDGRQAIEKVRQNKFDLVLMDISMPDMDGIEATKRIRELEQGVDLPIIAFSAFDDLEKQFNLKEIGISNILHKPAEISEIKNIIKQYV